MPYYFLLNGYSTPKALIDLAPTKVFPKRTGSHEIFAYQILLIALNMSNMFLKSVSFGIKECTEELKLESASFLGQTS